MRPNILFIVLDAVRYDHVSANGYDRETTPKIDRLAEDGVRFENAFAAAPWTPPSHASIFSGTYPSEHGYLDGGMELNTQYTLAELLSQQGYTTFGAVQNAKIGENTDISRGFDDYLALYRLPFLPKSYEDLRQYYFYTSKGFARIAKTVRNWGERKPSEYIAKAAVESEIRRATASDQPFFGFVNLNAAHSIYAPPDPFLSNFDRVSHEGIDMDTVQQLADRGGYRFIAGELNPSEAEWRAVKDRYDGEIAFADSLAGELISYLKNLNEYENTIIVVTSDHGEHFGEYGRAYHQFSLFDELLHVPLVFKRAENSSSGAVRSDLASHIDLFPTILEECGITDPEWVEGASLFNGDKRDVIAAEYGKPKTAIKSLRNNTKKDVPQETLDKFNHGLQCVRTVDRKLISRSDGEEIVTIGHPGSERVIDPEENDVRIDDLRDRLSSELDELGKLSVTNNHSKEVRKNLKELGYL